MLMEHAILLSCSMVRRLLLKPTRWGKLHLYMMAAVQTTKVE